MKKGKRVPMLVWAYLPREFVDADAASQVVASPNKFTAVTGSSHLLLLTQGYAIFDGPTMPIVGAGETANDTYVEQLVASAEAAIDKAVDLGIADRSRIGVGGHGYGAFMTANLLAHSDLFAAGIARSGAYNRADAFRLSGGNPDLLGGPRCLREDVAVLECPQDQRADAPDPWRGR